jgi:hypothetical protein
MPKTLIEALPRSDMLLGMAYNEAVFPKLSQLVGCLADPENRLTMFVQQGANFLPPVGSSAASPEVFLSHMLGSHTIRGLHSIASLGKSNRSVDSLAGDKLVIKGGKVNGVQMVAEQVCSNGTLIVVSGPLFKPDSKIGTKASSRVPAIEDMIAVPSIKCACCGKDDAPNYVGGALYCNTHKNGVGGKLVDEKPAWVTLSDRSTGQSTVFVSGLFHRMRNHVKHMGHGHGHYFDRVHAHLGAQKIGLHGGKGKDLHGSLHDSSSSSSSSSSEHQKKKRTVAYVSASSSSSSSSGEDSSSSDSSDSHSIGDQIAADLIGISLRRFRRSKNLTPEERRLKAQIRKTKFQEDLAKAERKRNKAQSKSGSGGSPILEDEMVASAPPRPVNSLRELLAIQGQSPRNLSTKTVKPIKSASQTDTVFVKACIAVLSDLEKRKAK